MIDYKELRSGNLINWGSVIVKFSGTAFFGDGQFQMQNQRLIPLIEYRGHEFYQVAWENLFPIPITAEVLENVDWNGYKKLHINSSFAIDDVGHLYYHNDYTGINIDYLHQLQNLYYSLTGTELIYNQ